MEFWRTLSDIVSDAVDTVSDAAGTVYDTVSDAAGTVYDTASDAAGTVYDTVSDAPVGMVVGGAIIGVTAVAAAPFTGGGSVLAGASLIGSLAGTGTVVAALGVGAAGATAGYMAGEAEKDARRKEKIQDREEGRKAGELAAKSEYASMVEYSIKRFEKIRKEISLIQNDNKQFLSYCQKIVKMFAVGVAVAHRDGRYSPESQKAIGEFTVGISGSALPEAIYEEIRALEENPPSIEVAVANAKDAGIDDGIIHAIMFRVAMADGVACEDEGKFMEEFKRIENRVA